ncbi:MAG: DUF3052 domain-containing protein [Propionibacteriaceae bacterium]|nr:DUF3052 domain-containing protein [Propionibacteriaceae bacterium]
MASTGKDHSSNVASKLGLVPGMVVQELGWDSDADEQLRSDLMDAIDADMVEEAVEAVDVVVLWWRKDDGDVVDGLVDSLTDLSTDGYIWLLTPKLGRPGFVDPSDLAEGAVTAGMALTTSATVSPDWQAHKIVRPKGNRR